MSNLKEFTKAEFLSFLYAEKSREVENNSVPGWNKWALIGAIFTVVVFLYKTFVDVNFIFNHEIFAKYLIFLLSFVLLYLLNNPTFDNVRTYMSSKIRLLKEEAPVLSHIFQLIICLSATVIQLCFIGTDIIFWNLLLSLIINIIIIIYIGINRNKYVLAQLRSSTFINKKNNYIVDLLLFFFYFYPISYSICHNFKQLESFHSLEFELAIGLTSLIPLLYLLLKIKYNNNSIAGELDRIIDKFIVGTITQEEAYRQYILMIYGFSAYQTIENHLDIIENVKNNYNNKIDIINNLKSQLKNEIKSFDDLQKIQQTLEKEIYDSRKTRNSLSKLLDKIIEISKLGIPAIVDNEFSAAIDDYNKAFDLFSDLITQIESVMQEVIDKYYCKKYGGLCLISHCTQSNDPMSLKYKIKRKIRLFFKLFKLHI